MVPTFEFRFLICSYLPGVPLSLAIYLLFLKSRLDNNYFTLYMIISPLVIGLFVDGIRHGIELKAPLWKQVPLIKDKEKYDQVSLSHILSRSEAYFHMYEFFSNFAISLLLTLVVIFDKVTYSWSVPVAVMIFVSAFLAYVFIKEQEQKVIKELN